ncbi:hypothetical protein [Pseudomonas sp. Sample_24]|uniref:hypothetical protein n=1 Tax=Pseudomonas sp. Sample_24 TaxID=2448268 RepID=UPI001032897B|nr:hypothetical protein [Pseudomonas sp. Sample_24]
MLRTAKKLVLATALFSTLSVTAHALEPQHFDSLPAMVEDFGDFSEENGTFKVLSAKPLHVQFSPHVVPGDLPENVRYEVQRAALYGVFRTFVHTSADAVQVTAAPLEIDIKNGGTRKLKGPAVDITVTRAQALAAVKKFIQVNDFSDLVDPQQMGKIQVDNWTKDFESLYYKQPNIDRLLVDLKAKQV